MTGPGRETGFRNVTEGRELAWRVEEPEIPGGPLIQRLAPEGRTATGKVPGLRFFA